MFPGFEELEISTVGTTIRGRRGGDGPPLLLLHAQDFTVIATDLRGFGHSAAPASTPDHAPYSMWEIARDQLEVMEQLGFARFGVAGHDRGGRCAYRLALDHPEAQTLIARAPEVLVNHMLDAWSGRGDPFPQEVRAAYIERFSDAETVHAICEEYRAAATLDVQHDEADRGRRRISCPVLALWSRSGPVGSWYEPLELWREWADDVQGDAMDAGHFLPEEAPEETVRRLRAFFSGGRPGWNL